MTYTFGQSLLKGPFLVSSTLREEWNKRAKFKLCLIFTPVHTWPILIVRLSVSQQKQRQPLLIMMSERVFLDTGRWSSTGCFQYNTEAFSVIFLVNCVDRKCSRLTHCVLCVFWSSIWRNSTWALYSGFYFVIWKFFHSSNLFIIYLHWTPLLSVDIGLLKTWLSSYQGVSSIVRSPGWTQTSHPSILILLPLSLPRPIQIPHTAASHSPKMHAAGAQKRNKSCWVLSFV